MLKPRSLRWRLTLALPMMLLLGCTPPLVPQSAEPAKIPALPPQARVSLVPIPSICSQGCSRGVTMLRENSASTLTGSPLLGVPASASATDYSLPLGKLLKP